MNDHKKACELGEQALSEALEKIDDVDEETFRDAKSIIELLKENLSLWKEEDGDNAVEDLWTWYPSANESYIYKTWEDPFFIDRIVQFYYLYLDDHLFRLNMKETANTLVNLISKTYFHNFFVDSIDNFYWYEYKTCQFEINTSNREFKSFNS